MLLVNIGNYIEARCLYRLKPAWLVGFDLNTNFTLPTGALDAETGCMVLLELQKLSRDEGKTVLLVTHNANIARAADRVIHVRSGEIKEIQCNADPCSMKEVEW